MCWSYSLSKDWEVRILTDRAGVSSLYLNVSVVSPLDTPRIFNQPIIFCGSNHKDSVVDFITAINEDSFLIISPCERINSYCYRTFEQSSVKPSACDVAAIRLHFKRTSSLFAILIFASIGIYWFSVYTFVLEVLERVPKLTPVAAFVPVLGRAVDQLLLWKRNICCPSMDQICALQGSDRAERPTRSTHLLVFDSSNFTLLFPVNLNLIIPDTFIKEGSFWAFIADFKT